MTQEQIRAFVARDWAGLAAAKAFAWQAVLTVRPDWPSPDDRADDLRNHIRVSEALGALAIRPR